MRFTTGHTTHSRAVFQTARRAPRGTGIERLSSYGISDLGEEIFMTKLLILSAAVLIGSPTFATAQGAGGQSSGTNPPTQCWDQATNQLRQRTADDASKNAPPEAGQSEGGSTVGDGSSEGMAGLIPGTKGSASKRAAAESASPSASARPPGMPDC
jgi:hypothetical protein